MDENRYKLVEAEVLTVVGRTNTDHGSAQGVKRFAGGQSSGLEIKIKSETPIKTLNFEGCWPIENGDNIRFYIDLLIKPPRYVNISETLNDEITYRKELREIENPSKIEKLRFGRVVATYFNGPEF